MSDLSQAVLDLLGAAGDARLPSLTRDELFALGDEPALAHGEDERWWAALDTPSRSLVAETAQRGLIARNLVVATEGDPPLVVADSVQVVLRARHSPAWLVVLGEPGADEGVPAVQVALLGIDLAAHETSAVLIQTRLVGIWAHRLTRPDVAVDAAVSWLLRPPLPGQDVVGRTVEVLLPAAAPGSGTTDVRAVVMTNGAEAVLAGFGSDAGPEEPAEPPEPRPLDAGGLRRWLVNAVGSLADPGGSA